MGSKMGQLLGSVAVAQKGSLTTDPAILLLRMYIPREIEMCIPEIRRMFVAALFVIAKS